MAHMMEQQMNPMDRQMMDQGQMEQDMGGLTPMEPWRDETGHAAYYPMNGWNGENMNGMNGSPVPGMGGTVYPTGPSAAFAQSQRMKNPVDMETTHTPTNSKDAYEASLRSLLARNVGYFIVATFLTGTSRMITWQGILHTVGSDYIVIYQPDYERYISCDFYALKFVQFHNARTTPYCVSSNAWTGQDS